MGKELSIMMAPVQNRLFLDYVIHWQLEVDLIFENRRSLPNRSP